MGCFRNICLVEARHTAVMPHSQSSSDLIQLCYLAAAVHGQVETLSMPVDYFSRNPSNDLEILLKNHPVDLVAISSMTGAFSNALRLAHTAKRFGKYVVMGGYHPSALPGVVISV